MVLHVHVHVYVPITVGTCVEIFVSRFVSDMYDIGSVSFLISISPNDLNCAKVWKCRSHSCNSTQCP